MAKTSGEGGKGNLKYLKISQRVRREEDGQEESA